MSVQYLADPEEQTDVCVCALRTCANWHGSDSQDRLPIIFFSETLIHGPKFRDSNFILRVAQFNIIVFSLNEKQMKRGSHYKSRGALGTGFPTAPILLFELLPSDKLWLYESLRVRQPPPG